MNENETNIHVIHPPTGTMYHMMHGTTLATFFVLPMLDKHPDEYPRYRDCFLSDEEHPEYDDHIHVYTRVGGGNRKTGLGEEELYKNKHYVTTFDDSYDSTYATYVFKVPTKWIADFKKFKERKIKEFSEEYKKQLYKIYPKLKDKLDEIFKKAK